MLKKLGLIISPVSPYPTDQGNRIRLREVCENIAAIDNTAVDFLLFPLDFNPKADLFTVKKRLQRVFRDVLIGPYYERWHTPPLDNFRHSIDEWISEEMKSFARSLLSKHKYDFVIVNYVFFSGLLDLFPCSTFKIIDTHDVLSEREKLFDKIGQPKDFFWCSKEEEKKGLERADLILSIKKSELNYFSDFIDRKILNLPVSNTYSEFAHPANSCVSSISSSSGQPMRVGFIGAGTKWNIAAIKNFIADTYQLLYKKQFYIEIIIAGRICNLLSDLEDYPHVYLMGEVDNVESFYNSIDIILNPDFCSTGLKIKTIEALNQNKLLVSSYHATDGLAAKTPLLSCTSNSKIIDHLFSIAKNPSSYPAYLSIQKKTFEFHQTYCQNQFKLLSSEISSFCNSFSIIVFDSKSLLSCYLTRELLSLKKNDNCNIYLHDISYNPINSLVALGEFSQYCKILAIYRSTAVVDFEQIILDLEDSSSSSYELYLFCHQASGDFVFSILSLLNKFSKEVCIADFFIKELLKTGSSALDQLKSISQNVIIYPTFFVDEVLRQKEFLRYMALFDYFLSTPLINYYVDQRITINYNSTAIFVDDLSSPSDNLCHVSNKYPVIQLSTILTSYMSWHSLELPESLVADSIDTVDNRNYFGFWKFLQDRGINIITGDS